MGTLAPPHPSFAQVIPLLRLCPIPSRCNPTLGLLSVRLHSLQETYEAKRKEFLSELQRKEEEMRQMFVNKVKETELELKEKEREVRVGSRSGRGQVREGGAWPGSQEAPVPPLLPAAREV